jgi:hypothetical protein
MQTNLVSEFTDFFREVSPSAFFSLLTRFSSYNQCMHFLKLWENLINGINLDL